MEKYGTQPMMKTRRKTLSTACVAILTRIRTIKDIRLYVEYARPLRTQRITKESIPSACLVSRGENIADASRKSANGSDMNTPIPEIQAKRLISLKESGYDLARSLDSTALAEKNTFEKAVAVSLTSGRRF